MAYCMHCLFLGVGNGKVSFEFCETDEHASWHSCSFGRVVVAALDNRVQGEAKGMENYYLKRKKMIFCAQYVL
jgi:hypothetical protein